MTAPTACGTADSSAAIRSQVGAGAGSGSIMPSIPGVGVAVGGGVVVVQAARSSLSVCSARSSTERSWSGRTRARSMAALHLVVMIFQIADVGRPGPARRFGPMACTYRAVPVDGGRSRLTTRLDLTAGRLAAPIAWGRPGDDAETTAHPGRMCGTLHLTRPTGQFRWRGAGRRPGR